MKKIIITQERTRAGLLAKRARWRVGEKTSGLIITSRSDCTYSKTLYLERKLSARQIAERLGICKATLYAYLRPGNVKIGPEFYTLMSN